MKSFIRLTRKTILITLKQPKQHTVLSMFRLHAGSLLTSGAGRPDEGFRREAETSIKQYIVLVVLE